MTYYGRYQHPDGRWMKWLEFSGRDDARQHCLRMAAGREIELLSEEDYNLKFNQVPAPEETDKTGAFERLIEGLEESRNTEHFEESEDMENLKEDNSQELEKKRNVGRSRIDRPAKSLLQSMYIDQGLSIRAIAAELGLSRDFIHTALREYGIETRSTFKPSKLAKYPLELIKGKVRALGYQRAAHEFGVALSTLYFFMKTRRQA